jgi:predicted ATPase
MTSVADASFVFGPFRLLPAKRVLLQDGRPVQLGGRAFDLLACLVQHAGRVIANDELMAQVWPNIHVDENTLRVHIAALRRTLDDGSSGNRYIANAPGRGYSFVTPVSRERVDSADTMSAAHRPASNLPISLTRVIGRDEIIASLAAQVRARRFLTILGPGGVGKTTVAVAIAEALADAYADGIRFVGLGSLVEPALVSATVLAAFGGTPTESDATMSLTTLLRDKRVLIVLDNCEHVVQPAAALAVTLLQAVPGVAILATSREALRAEGEWVQRLPSLAVPAKEERLSAAEALTFAAVQLFNERAMASVNGFVLTDEEVPVAVDICRRLDGIPFAIELAAARMDVYGLRGLATLITDRLLLAARGRRTAQPRHQTLSALLDWSYDLLSETEAAVLRRLSVFADDFSLDAAKAVAGDIAGAALTDQLVGLIQKSLIVADLADDGTRYRLLTTTRLYALEKLRAAGEERHAVERHDEYRRQSIGPGPASGG